MTRIAEQIRGRLGFAPMAPEQGLELFDAARELAEPLLAPVRFDTAALHARAEAGTLAPILRGLVSAPAQRETQRGSLGRLLAETPEAERAGVVLDLVRSHAAAVLGHPSVQEVEAGRAFKEMGLDSLGAVAAQPSQGCDRPRDRRDRRLRPPDPAALGRLPACRGGGERRRQADRLQGPGKRRADCDRRHGLPLPRCDRLPS